MSPETPMRFGHFIPQGWRMDLAGIPLTDHWKVMSGLARRADAGPWESVWVYDHFHTSPAPTENATHEAWSLMSAFGAVTSRVRLGQMCTCMAYRNPAYLAKVAATADMVSGGRIEMGIGAGWYEHEWRAYGYGFPAARDRLGMLDEGVQIMRQAWTTGSATLDGKHYQVNGALVRPLPVQDGGIPLWIAGGGEKVTLRIAAKYASYTNFAGTPEEFRHKSEVLAAHCEAVGTDHAAITRSGNFNVLIGATDAEVAQKRAWLTDHLVKEVGTEKAQSQLENYTVGVGTPEQIVANLSQYRVHGLAYMICYFPEIAYDTSGLELFEQQVIPALG